MFSNLQEHNTKLLLLSISNKLSSRADCSKVEYRVDITSTNIVMIPERQCYPNLHKRKSADRLNVVTFCMNKLGFELSELVPGSYIYKLSVSKRRRRWMKEDSYDSIINSSKSLDIS